MTAPGIIQRGRHPRSAMHVAAVALRVLAVVVAFMALVLTALGRRRLATGFTAMIRLDLQRHVLDTEVIVQAAAQLSTQ